jgi:hypothetical protein
MGVRTSQLQIRVTPDEKATLKRLADAAGESVSSYVLARVLPSAEMELIGLYRRLTETGVDHRVTLSELGAVLERIPGYDFADHVPPPSPDAISSLLLNCVAAMTEAAAHRKGVDPPSWTVQTPTLSQPHFGWALPSLRPHQIRVAPVPFKRRNIFFDPARGPSP